jgi:hypothetical protein
LVLRDSRSGGGWVSPDILPRTSAEACGSSAKLTNDCYFATLNSTDTTNIADNNNFDGPETVDVSGVYAFQINGPCTWVLVP